MGAWEFIPHQSFYDMIRPAFIDTADTEDIRAILRRAHVVLASHDYVYYRLAHREEVDVARMRWPDKKNPDFLVPEARPIIYYSLLFHIMSYSIMLCDVRQQRY
eukprot:10526301-Heterocapsa_arctica.AAC.1